MLVKKRPSRPSSYSPKAKLKLVASDDSPAKSRPLGLAESSVVKEEQQLSRSGRVHSELGNFMLEQESSAEAGQFMLRQEMLAREEPFVLEQFIQRRTERVLWRCPTGE